MNRKKMYNFFVKANSNIEFLEPHMVGGPNGIWWKEQVGLNDIVSLFSSIIKTSCRTETLFCLIVGGSNCKFWRKNPDLEIPPPPVPREFKKYW